MLLKMLYETAAGIKYFARILAPIHQPFGMFLEPRVNLYDILFIVLFIKKQKGEKSFIQYTDVSSVCLVFSTV